MKTPRERLNGLRWRLRAMRRLWRAGAAPNTPFIAPPPFDAEPRGCLDAPAGGEEIGADTIEIHGWTVFPSSPTSRVEAWLGETPLGRARVGAERTDLAAETDHRWARFSGFELSAELPEGHTGDDAVRVTAVSADGQRQDFGPVPVTISGEKGESASPGSLPPPPASTPVAPSGPGRRLLVYTHQLNLGGAQLYLMDLLRELLRQGAVQPTVVSAHDGSLREDLEALGVPVHIAGPFPMEDLGAHLGRLEELVAWTSGRDFELVLVNTATALALPGAELAARLEIPAAWAIHESFPLDILWGPQDQRVRELGEAALANASLVLFEAEATRRMFAGRVRGDVATMLPYGLDLGPIDAEREEFDAAAARRQAGIPADAEVVLCVGTVEPRKAQLPLSHAFDLIADTHPHAHLVFVGVGDGPYSETLADFCGGTAWRDRAHLVGITPHVQRWYGMADVLVCASDIESLPRTVLEAMAWETPVLATSVFGLPELIEEGETGWLCEPRDTSALAGALQRVLDSSAAARSQIGRQARERVVQRHSLPAYGREVARLLDRLLDPDTSRTPQPGISTG